MEKQDERQSILVHAKSKNISSVGNKADDNLVMIHSPNDLSIIIVGKKPVIYAMDLSESIGGSNVIHEKVQDIANNPPHSVRGEHTNVQNS